MVHMQKIKVKSQPVQKIEWKQMGEGTWITSCANVVGN